MSTKYSFDSAPAYADNNTRRGRHRRHNNNNNNSSNNGDDDDQTDGNGSLTYSAASSINSAGESTDSSFAGIMKVLDGQDTNELAAYLKLQAAKHRTDERSVAESLAYSTDAESHFRSLASNADASGLHGTELLSTITGQASHQMYDGGPNTGGVQTREDVSADDDLDIMFSPAEHTDSLKRRKENKKRRKSTATPRVKNSSRGNSGSYATNSASPVRRESASRSDGGLGTTTSTSQRSRPPKATTADGATLELQEDDDIWYAKWWMFCFPDTIKNMSPKR